MRLASPPRPAAACTRGPIRCQARRAALAPPLPRRAWTAGRQGFAFHFAWRVYVLGSKLSAAAAAWRPLSLPPPQPIITTQTLPPGVLRRPWARASAHWSHWWRPAAPPRPGPAGHAQGRTAWAKGTEPNCYSNPAPPPPPALPYSSSSVSENISPAVMRCAPAASPGASSPVATALRQRL